MHSPTFAQDPKWELEGHGGLSFAVGSPDGVSAMPTAGALFTTVNGRPSRRVSSWLFGDGALLLNQVYQQYGHSPRPAPLDSVLQGPLIEPQDGGAFGFRFGRRLSSKLIADLTVDRLPEVREPEEAYRKYISAAATFNAMWGTLLPGAEVVSTDFRTTEESQGRLLVTGAANFEFGGPGKLRPYFTGGAGIERRTDKSPTASITGSYSYSDFGVPDFAPLESDQVKLSGKTTKNRPVGVAGGGVRIPLSQRLGLRADIRAYLSGNREETFVSTTTPPARVAGASSTYYERGTNPAIQLQSFRPPFPDSEVSFSGPQISNFLTFQGKGIETAIAFTMGVFWRF